jgi:hypothetical protein
MIHFYAKLTSVEFCGAAAAVEILEKAHTNQTCPAGVLDLFELSY